MCYQPIKVNGYFFSCGRCAQCVKQKREEWVFRLLYEGRQHPVNKFITLTYMDEYIPVNQNGIETLDKLDFQKFMKRLRKQTNQKLRYYAIGEYGTKYQRPHYHALIFNWDNKKNDLSKAWPLGKVDEGTVTIKSIKYVTKYMMNPNENESLGYYKQKPFSLMSRAPMLGENYVNDDTKEYHWKNLTFKTRFQGKEYIVPKRFRSLLIPSKIRRDAIATMDLSEQRLKEQREESTNPFYWKDFHVKREVREKLKLQFSKSKNC